MDAQQAAEKADRLLTLANVYRMRGNTAEAARTCQEALAADPDNAVAHELMGDLQAAQGQLDSAMAHYRQAFTLDPRPGTEEKIALLALRIDQEKRLGPGAGGSGLPTASRKHLNPSLACLLSMLFPGLGQFYNGEYRKGLPLVVIWLVLLYNLYYLMGALFGPLLGMDDRAAIPGFAWVIGLVQVGVMVYSLVDASLSAVAINRGETPGKKSGWEI
ncbi:MAG: tetratricopeptide repeat protein [Armatimonadetes bacterium]|nr:tetratricopeptide repeat protein [Armatimonadota bacterium]